MDASRTALVLIGYQRDFFAPDGALHSVIEQSAQTTLDNTMELLEHLVDSPVLVLSAPILFTPGYRELIDPVGILAEIRDRKAFLSDTPGGRVIEELERFGDRIIEIPGRRGLNAFSNTHLDRALEEHGITDIVLAGAVTSVCVDSTGRSAHERGYRVSVLSDCTSGRTPFEQRFFCENIFPLYATVLGRQELVSRLGLRAKVASRARGVVAVGSAAFSS